MPARHRDPSYLTTCYDSCTQLRRKLASACTFFVDVTELSDGEAARVIDAERVQHTRSATPRHGRSQTETYLLRHHSRLPVIPNPYWPPWLVSTRSYAWCRHAHMHAHAQVHVLLNLAGHTAGCRHVVTQWRPAPVQALHYGYPSTSALPAVGYMQVDAVAAPPAFRRDFTEKLALFPHSHFVAVHAARYPHVGRATQRAHPWAHEWRSAGGVATAQGQRWQRRLDGERLVETADGELLGRADLGLGPVGSRDASFAMCNFNQV